jgi:hypothetical protein
VGVVTCPWRAEITTAGGRDLPVGPCVRPVGHPAEHRVEAFVVRRGPIRWEEIPQPDPVQAAMRTLRESEVSVRKAGRRLLAGGEIKR